ncbi:hypothetical protein EX30DRAFT_293034, partial [Ascodesmis nigricans]
QFGSRPARSTLDAALQAVTEVEDLRKAKKKSAMVMVNVKNAFQSVTSETMARCLGEVGCPDDIREWVRGFMGER